ncbi:hypothetical protein NOR_00899 [Metarhizium rileyi]|uniref:PHD finger domain protein n=1 Tax=Metarhizium rileyi (strain RCEF 4871) TaxID=1649241 RepID=A0A167JLB8_METRR|nr:hypothetical protein NOR_00899 [Metarhizium rileyi RCEF 4871]
MNEDQLAASSFGDPNAQPPTPNQTPASTACPSPIFETPKHYQGSFTESSGLTPRFAEEYSVFNATPGNLRGTQVPFLDLFPVTSAGSSAGHKRLSSAEVLTAEISAHANHLSPNQSAALPPVAAAHRLPSSPNPSVTYKAASTAGSQPQPGSNHSRTPTSSSKKARRGIITEEEATQVISPPPTARKGERKLASKLNMQNDQCFGHPDLHDPSQQELAALMSSATDIFGYPMSAPAATQPNFWDPTMSVNMDLDFTTTGPSIFPPPTTSSHRHTDSFDWNSEIQLFQDPIVPPSSNQENVQPTREERTLAPRPTSSGLTCTSAHEPSLSASFAPMLDDSFSIISAGDVVDPGLLFSRPQSAPMDPGFGNMVQCGTAEAAIQSGKAQSGDARRSGSAKNKKNTTKGSARATISSPVKSLGRPGLGRSMSENRGRKTARGGSLPVLAPAAMPAPGPGLRGSKSTSRLTGRVSPLKTRQRLSSLASIPESSPQTRQRTSIRFSIDAHGRATVQTLLGGGGTAMTRSLSSQDLLARPSWSSVEDDEDTDDEPIIIPSRNNSFNASFALPDPLKPIGSLFSSRRSIGGRSTSNSTNEGESEAETVVNEKPGKVGDAASELRKVVEYRQKRSLRRGSARSSERSLDTTNIHNYPGGIISPTSLTDSSYGPDSYNVRCVCNNSRADEGDGFMVQWYVSFTTSKYHIALS